MCPLCLKPYSWIVFSVSSVSSYMKRNIRKRWSEFIQCLKVIGLTMCTHCLQLESSTVRKNTSGVRGRITEFGTKWVTLFPSSSSLTVRRTSMRRTSDQLPTIVFRKVSLKCWSWWLSPVSHVVFTVQSL